MEKFAGIAVNIQVNGVGASLIQDFKGAEDVVLVHSLDQCVAFHFTRENFRLDVYTDSLVVLPGHGVALNPVGF